jgi:hypothetical protein
LVTPDFLASDFIYEHELGPSLKEAEQGGVKVLWVPVRTSAYKQTALKNYQAALSPDTPLAAMTMAKRDRAWLTICEVIQSVLTVSTDRSPKGGPVTSGTPASPDRRVPPEREMPDDAIFISFPIQDLDAVKVLQTGLERTGLPAWFIQRKLPDIDNSSFTIWLN